MTQNEWKKKIKAECESAKSYRPFFDSVIDQLAQMLEMRDKAIQAYEENGGEPVTMHTNKAGHANFVKNPALVIINDVNQQALSYWKELGLTPQGYKKLNTGDVEHDNTFEEMLAKVGI